MTAPPRTEFDAFLFAPVGDDSSGMPLTLLSVLARLGVDPWDEAARLAQLPRESATQRLISLLGERAGAPVPHLDLAAIAARLVALLHRSPKTQTRLPGAPPQENLVKAFKGARPAIYYLAAVIFLLICQWALGATRFTL